MLIENEVMKAYSAYPYKRAEKIEQILISRHAGDADLQRFEDVMQDLYGLRRIAKDFATLREIEREIKALSLGCCILQKLISERKKNSVR